MTTGQPDRGVRALAERLSDLWLTGGTSSDWAAAILANGAVFLPDAAELDRLRRIEAAARALDNGWSSTDEGKSVRLRYASDLPRRLNALRAALEPEGSARDGG